MQPSKNTNVDSLDTIESILNSYREQGLSFYEANQKLLNDGYTQMQIDDVQNRIATLNRVNLNQSENNQINTSDKNLQGSYDVMADALLGQVKKENKPQSIFTRSASSSTYERRLQGSRYIMSHGYALVLFGIAAIIFLILLFSHRTGFIPGL